MLKQKCLEAFLAINDNHTLLVNIGVLRPPTIRIVKPGAFMEYRHWTAENKGAGINQVKVPVVMRDSSALEWIMDRVVREL